MLRQELIVSGQLLATGKTELFPELDLHHPNPNVRKGGRDKRVQKQPIKQSSKSFFCCRKGKKLKCEAHFGNNKFREEYSNEFRDKLFKLLK